MKNWQETAAVLERIAELAAKGRRSALAIVTAIEGSAYRRPGAKLLVDEEGGTLGGVSGGCLEADVREVALACLADGQPRHRHYTTGEDDDVVWGLGLGCDGKVDVLVKPVPPDGDPALIRARSLLQGVASFALATVIDGRPAQSPILAIEPDGARSGTTGDSELDRQITGLALSRLETGEGGIEETGGVRVFVEVLRPPPRLLIFGAGDDAVPLASWATLAGFCVTVVDHRPAHVTRERYPSAELAVRGPEQGLEGLPHGPETYAVVMTHALSRDRAWVRALIQTEVAYVGILGPRTRREEVLESLGAPPDDRIYGPVGLDVGAHGPEQIAVSILAELLAVLNGRSPEHLRDRTAAIHGGAGAGRKEASIHGR